MSLLMDALKQQQQVPVAAEQTASGHGWRIVALILLVVLGLVLGFFVGQYQFNKKEPAALVESVAAPVVQAAPVIANAADIAMELQLAADLLKPAEAVQLKEVPQAEPQLVVSARRGERVLGRSTDEDFVDFEQMQEADLHDDLTPVDELLPAAELEQSEVSAELRGKFESALAAADGSQLRQQQINYHDAPAQDINQLDDLLQRQLPSLRFEAHVYATDAKQRWIKVNGKDLQQGQWVTADIQVKEILPQYVVLQFNQTQFSVAALADWSYR
ncbi:general secretion pathway protein GspB [Rheinheimera soli]|uniref:Type II secretion system protein GspB C-terminal domain-containing protein n=1 Tax=Rheinheimera soli TaxID=443616 RepID=A0ABU1VWK8_9GAMM|nr:general secretion pathway protein GspB [Rheinheimera soli]MDR7120104.1 hypothetical protein [Rheinheimera soli]